MRRLLIAFVLALLCSAPAQAQITLIDSAIGDEGAGDVTLDCTGASHLFAFLSYDSFDFFPTSMTFNGDSLTKIAETVAAGSGTGQYQALYFLASPDQTSGLLADADNSSKAGFCVTGLDSGTPHDTADVVQTPTTATTISSGAIGSAIGDLVLSHVAVNGITAGGTTATGTGQTELEEVGDAAHYTALSSSTGAASVTATWTWSGNRAASVITVNLNVAAAAGGPQRLLLLGVGQ